MSVAISGRPSDKSGIPPQTFATFKLLVRNPATPGTSLWKIEQYYQDGNVATWEAQTQIVPQASMGGTQRRGSLACRAGGNHRQFGGDLHAVTLIIVTAIGIVQSSRSQREDEQS